jgi:hypothetical protein
MTPANKQMFTAARRANFNMLLWKRPSWRLRMMDDCPPQQVNCTNLKNHAGPQSPLFLFIIHQNSH